MNPLMQELQQHAALQVEVAFEAGYDAAAEVAYNAGYDDGHEVGFDEALQIITTTRDAFGVDSPTFDDAGDAGDECDCPVCREERAENPPTFLLTLTGDWEVDRYTLVYGLTLMTEKIFDTEAALVETLDLLEESTRCSIELARRVETLQVQVDGLQRDAELAEADALFLDSLANRIADLEALNEVLV